MENLNSRNFTKLEGWSLVVTLATFRVTIEKDRHPTAGLASSTEVEAMLHYQMLLHEKKLVGGCDSSSHEAACICQGVAARVCSWSFTTLWVQLPSTLLYPFSSFLSMPQH